jgi:hypothetical protein
LSHYRVMPGSGRVRSLLAGEPEQREEGPDGALDGLAPRWPPPVPGGHGAGRGWAALWPRGFYDDFPWPGHPAVVFGVAAVTLDRRLAPTVLAAYLGFALPHLVFHLEHLGPFGAGDAVAQSGDAGGHGGAARAPARPAPPGSRSSGEGALLIGPDP